MSAYEEDDYLNEDERRKQKEEERKLESLESVLLEQFDNILDQYEDVCPGILKKSHPLVVRSLRKDLKNLWIADVKFFRLWRAGTNEEEETFEYSEILKKRYEMKDHLYQHGEHYKRFWFKKNYFEKFIKILEKHAEKNFPMWASVLSGNIFGPIELSDEASQMIKMSTENFIKDLKETRAGLKDNLRGRFYWLKVSLKFATVYVLPWLVALVVMANFLKCNDSLGS